MSGAGAPDAAVARRRVPAETRLVILATRWNRDVIDLLLQGARRAAQEHQVARVRVEYVDGALELPLAAARLADVADAIVALGAVVQGQTPHFEHVSRAAVDGLMQVGLSTGVAVGNAVLTCHTRGQALERAGGPGASEDKGYEATLAALDLTALRP